MFDLDEAFLSATNEYRKALGLPPLEKATDGVCVICQQPFDECECMEAA